MEQLKQGLGDAWSAIATFFPKLFGFLIILLVGWLIAKAVAKGLTVLLSRLGFDRLIEKTGLSGMLNQSQIDATGIIVKLVYYFILLITLQLALTPFGPTNPVSRLLDQVITYLPRIVVAIVLVVVAAAIANVVRDLIRSAMAGRNAAGVLGNGAYYLIVAFGVIAALGQLGIAVSITGPVLIAVLATVGGVVIVGFGGGLIKATSERWPSWLDNMEGQFKGGAHAAPAPTQGSMGGQLRHEPQHGGPLG